MKTNKITSINLNNFPENNKRSARPHNPSFNGLISTGIVGTMDAVERGGIAASFTVQDMFGTNFPRTIKGLYRNKDITGEYNFQEAKEVALREFITGPSMFIIPMTALCLIKKYAGKAFSVPIARTKAFSGILNDNKKLINADNLKSNNALFKQEYYTKVFENVLKSSIPDLSEREISENAADFARRLIDIEGAKPKNIFQKLFNKKIPTSKDSKIDEFVEKFVALTKASNGEKTKDLFAASISKDGKTVANAKITNLLTSLSDYTSDIIKSGSNKIKSFDDKSIGDFISSFTKTRIGGRFILNFLLCGSVIAFCTVIPKIYMRNKTFPGLNGLQNNEQQNQNAKSVAQNSSVEVKNENKQ